MPRQIVRYDPIGRRPRRQLFAPMAAAMAARRIQAAARGFLARRRVAGMRRPRLMSPMDISKIKRRKKQGQIPKGATRGVMPKYRIGSLIGTAKSSRKVKGKMDPLTLTEHRDVHATVQQPMVAYWGYADAGSLDDQLEMGVRTLVNMFVRRSGLKPTSIYQSFNESYLQDYSGNSDIRLKRIVIGYQGIANDGDITRDETSFDIADTQSVHLITTPVMADLKSKAFTNSFRPVRAILQEFVSGTYTTFATYDLESTMIDFSYMRKYKWQNVTPADTTQQPGEFNQFSVNDINANPLSGKIYQYKHSVPQVRGAKLDNEDLPQLQKIQNSEGIDGYLDTTAFRNGGFDSVLEFPFKQPYKSMEIFKDTVSEDKVYMPPGGYKQLIRKGKKTMNFARFCQATIPLTSGSQNWTTRQSGSDVEPRIGTSTIWGLEPVIRTTTNEVVRIATQMETWYTVKVRPGSKSVPICKINTVTAGSNFM